MTCPYCGSREFERYRSPRDQDDVTLRRHRCRECGTIFLSAQVAVDEALIDQLMELFA